MDKKVHENFNVFEYIDFLKDQKIQNHQLQADAVSKGDYIAAWTYQNDASTISWMIDDLTKFAVEGRHL